MTDIPAPGRAWERKRFLRIGLFILFLCLLAAPLLAGYSADDGWRLLSRHHGTASAWVAANYLPAVLLYILAYLLCTSLSVPCATWLTVGGGLLFGAVASTFYAVLGATAGATVIFLIARSFGGGLLRGKVGTAMAEMEQGFRRNTFSYLLVLRLLPIMPFWLVNLVPAFLGVSLRTYVAATLIGIVPATAIYASLGGGAAELLDRGERPNAGILFAPEFFLPLLGLALLALVPVLIGEREKRRV